MRNNYAGNKYILNCGDTIIIDKKSTKKIGNRYLWKAHFDGYEEARIFKLGKDLEYIDILNNISPIPDKYLELIKKYVNEIFKYDGRIS